MEVVAHVAAVAAGLALIVVTLLSAVKTVVLPRAVPSVLGRVVFLGVRRVFDVVAPASMPFVRRERVLAYYAPVSLLLLPGVWAFLLIVAFTLVYWGTYEESWWAAFEESGSSLLTLGFVRPDAPGHTVLVFAQATLGLGIVALLISYLPSIYAAFGRREQLVGMLEVRAGIPPSAAELLVRTTLIGSLDDLHRDLFSPWEAWFMDVEESHTSLPSLVFFRSPQPERSWITAAGCVLDTAALLDSAVDVPRRGESAIVLRTGFFALRRIADFFGIPFDPDPNPDDPISVSRREFDLLLVELQAAGVPLRADRDQAWRDFAGWRVNYDAVLVALCALVVAPPGRWSSDRDAPRPRPPLRPRARRFSAPPPRSPRPWRR
jgi:hypothetical protein